MLIIYKMFWFILTNLFLLSKKFSCAQYANLFLLLTDPTIECIETHKSLNDNVLCILFLR